MSGDIIDVPAVIDDNVHDNGAPPEQIISNESAVADAIDAPVISTAAPENNLPLDTETDGQGQNQSRRFRAPHSESDNVALDDLLRQGLPWKQVHQRMPHISKTNFYLKRDKFLKRGTTQTDRTSWRKTGRPRVLQPELEVFIKALMDEDPNIELTEITQRLKEEQGVEVSSSSISRAITRIEGKPRTRGLKSRRLGDLKRKRMEENEGQHDGGQVQQDGIPAGEIHKTGSRGAGGNGQPKRKAAARSKVTRPSTEIAGQLTEQLLQAGIAGPPTTPFDSFVRGAANHQQQSQTQPQPDTDTQMLDPELLRYAQDFEAARQKAISGPAPYPMPEDSAKDMKQERNSMQGPMYRSPYEPVA